jgi:hypothetical protein
MQKSQKTASSNELFLKKNFKLDSVQVYKCKEIFQKKGMITGLF